MLRKTTYRIQIMLGLNCIGVVTDTNKMRALAKAKAYVRALKDKKVELVITEEPIGD